MKYYILLSISSLNPNMVTELSISSADNGTLYSLSQNAIIDKTVNESQASKDSNSSKSNLKPTEQPVFCFAPW